MTDADRRRELATIRRSLTETERCETCRRFLRCYPGRCAVLRGKMQRRADELARQQSEVSS